MSSVLVVDVGTSNVKVGLVSPGGELLSHKSEEMVINRPEKGAAEHDPGELLDTVISLISEISEEYGGSIDALTLSGYQFGLLPLDEEMEPLTGIQTLLDTRSKVVMDKFNSDFPVEDIYSKTGCPSLFTYTLPRLVWMKEYKPDLFAESRYFSDIKGYLLYKLSGRFCTEPSVASATQLLNITDNRWDSDILNLAEIEHDSLPEIVAGDEIIGSLNDDFASSTGLKQGLPVIPGLYDGGAMILGMGGYSGEVGICNIGTTAMIRTCSPSVVFDSARPPRLQTYSLLPDRWAVGGAVNNAGVSLKWLRDNLSIDGDYDEIIDEAGEVDPGSDGVFCLPFLTGERDPRIGNMASGVFFGIKDYHSTGHLGRSVLEGVAYSLRMVLESLHDNDIDVESIRIGGAGASSDLWPRIVADVLNLPVTKAITSDATLIGNAMIVFTRLGYYSSLEEATDRMVRTGKTFSPDPENREKYSRGYKFFANLISTIRDLYPSHADEFLIED